MFTPTNKPTLSPDHHCHDCGGSLEVYRQDHMHGKFTDMGTCKNKACDLYSVTLELTTLANLSEEQLTIYRAQSIQLKARMKMLDKGWE